MLPFILHFYRNFTALRHLIDLKNIIASQLPKMHKKYIVKLLMDREHEAMIVIRRD